MAGDGDDKIEAMPGSRWAPAEAAGRRIVESTRARLTTRPSVESVITFGVVAAAVLFTFAQLQPGLIFAHTTPAGGDTGSHVCGPD